MRSMPYALLIPLALAILGVGVLLAQTVNLEEELTCDPNALVFDQFEAQLSLETFGADLEQDVQATLETLYTVGDLYQQLALDCGYIPDDIGTLFVGADVDRILTALDAVRGDPLNGQLLYNNEVQAADGTELGCVGCHLTEDSTGPLTEGTWTRWDEIRSLEPQFEEYSFEHYMVESIVLPWDYTVEGYPENIMPNNFGSRISYQDLADLIAYLESQDQFLPED